MIIGIAGKKQSGKDTVANIIQFLTAESKVVNREQYPITLWEYVSDKDAVRHWQLRRFADKLKDVTCLLTGCTRSQLEVEAFKNRKIGKQWERHEVYTIDPDGTKHILSLHENVNEAEDFWSTLHGSDNVKFGFRTIEMTYRDVLQYVGTDLFRRWFHPDTWVNATMSDYIETNRIIGDAIQVPGTMKYKIPQGYGEHSGKLINSNKFQYDLEQPEYPKWIIPDVRFPNEIDAIKERNGIVIRLQRPNNGTDNHLSETALDDYDGYDYIVNNDGNFEELIDKIKAILIKEKLIEWQ